MKTSNIALIVVMFVLGLIAGIIISQIKGSDQPPTPTLDQRGLSATPAALSARFDQMEARLAELTAALNQGDGQIKRVGQPGDGRQLSANVPVNRDNRARDPGLGLAPSPAQFVEIKGRIFNSLQDPATNFPTLMHSKEMQSLSTEQQHEVMRDVAARLDSGQLSKEQFLPGYRASAGSK